MPQTRQLAAIMFTDIVGYTVLMGQDETKALNKLRRFKEELALKVQEFEGKIIQYYGDGCLIIFTNAVDAVSCAKVLQEEFTKDPHVPVRIGIHLGDFLWEDDNIFGDSVNISSRIQSMGVPGSVLLSDAIRNQIKNKPEFQLTSLGNIEFKNVDDPIEVFALSNNGFPVPDKANLSGKFKEIKTLTPGTSLPPEKKKFKRRVFSFIVTGAILSLLAGYFIYKHYYPSEKNTIASNKNEFIEKSIAVLPFRNDSPEDSTQYFMDGVMEEILNNLQKIKDLRVISRTSVEQYRGQSKPISKIAEELGVNYIVEGSGQKYGSSFRLRAQLIMAKNESHLWGESFQQKITGVDDIFNIQIGIAKSIANELKAVITPEERKHIEKIPAADLEVYDQYLKARSYLTDFTRESLNKALKFLNSAIEKNPDWAPLYAGLAELWTWIQQAGWESPSVAGPKILENLNKAMELDPDLAEVHYQSAVIAQLVEWNWEKSEKEFLKALAINPNNPLSRLMYAQLLLILHRSDEALAQSKLAISLDPLNPNTKLLYIGTLVQAGDYKTSLLLMEEALAANPKDFNINGMLEIAAYKCKDYDKVIRAVKYCLPITIEEDAFKNIERIYRESGIVMAYKEIMKHLEKYAKNNYIGFSEMAIRYIIANQPDKAMDWVEKGFELHDPLMTYITTPAQYFDSLFGNPRFIAICKKMNLPLPKN